MPSVESNTKYKCQGCDAIWDEAQLDGHTGCRNCGNHFFDQVVIIHVCDFCARTEHEAEGDWWTFPCADFTHELQFPGTPVAGSKGPWSACSACADLINADDRTGLAKRSVEYMLGRHPEMKSRGHELLAITKRMQKGFFKHRTGPATLDGPNPIPPEEEER